jgi:hypothetical protein
VVRKGDLLVAFFRRHRRSIRLLWGRVW